MYVREEPEVRQRGNRHRKRYEEEARRVAEKRGRVIEDESESGEEDEGGVVEMEEEDEGWEFEEGERDVRLEDLVKVRVAKTRRRDRESEFRWYALGHTDRRHAEKHFEMLDPVRNVVALDEADFAAPLSRAPLPLDCVVDSVSDLDLDEWEEVDSSDAEDSDDDFTEFEDDIKLEPREGLSYARVAASTPVPRQAWLMDGL